MCKDIIIRSTWIVTWSSHTFFVFLSIEQNIDLTKIFWKIILFPSIVAVSQRNVHLYFWFIFSLHLCIVVVCCCLSYFWWACIDLGEKGQNNHFINVGFENMEKFSLLWFLLYRFSNTWINSHSYLTCYGFCCEIYLGYNLIVELFHFFSIPKDVKIDSSVCALKICFSVSYLFSLYIYAPIG